ncbi:hypothetical protein QTI66_01750 [Variovorax sp. J22R133]|uniref:hypothetical protein n=1 Tax=Variovorax brevis TaxID=3053503 RepID=UPI0025770C8C|nr:hypothetical protein [Variovorax sp. J22R133]MDM0110849.1 hypothetical protein [Variovorax sp. J22R133]
MNNEDKREDTARTQVLNPVDRVSEVLFGLFMALSFTGAISVADSGREQLREMYIAAIGCNLAWGLVDAVMYVVRTLTDRGRSISLVRSVRNSGAEAGRELIAGALSNVGAKFVAAQELEAIRGRIVALPSVPDRPRLTSGDVVAGVAIFLLVVVATFPVVLPFALIPDVAAAKWISRFVALAMLFVGGYTLGIYAGYGSSWKVGLAMAGLGTALVGAIMALGG